MTNGEVIKRTFPHYDIEVYEQVGFIRIFYKDFYTTYPMKWWNAEYEEPTPNASYCKLEDCVPRSTVYTLLKDIKSDIDDGYGFQFEDWVDEVRELPSVLPKAKGHWIEQIDHEENCRTLICSNCDRPALHDGDSIWKHKFCPHCGADMREEQEDGNNRA